MADELSEAWKNLKLTEEEEEIAIFDGEKSEERAEQIALCLLGRLMTESNFNVGAMKMVLKNIWKPSKGVVIKDLDNNLLFSVLC